ncbi:unnamed protein product [Rhizophagus irregularis]|nr:unnamed protein product [Rhizophagus irregularis]CAB5368418.1 unnamed protein product [Rhizophagus irregularis]
MVDEVINRKTPDGIADGIFGLDCAEDLEIPVLGSWMLSRIAGFWNFPPNSSSYQLLLYPVNIHPKCFFRIDGRHSVFRCLEYSSVQLVDDIFSHDEKCSSKGLFINEVLDQSEVD